MKKSDNLKELEQRIRSLQKQAKQDVYIKYEIKELMNELKQLKKENKKDT